MELALALIIFIAMIAVWFFLPGTVSTAETHAAPVTEGVAMAPAKA
jgi:hypothetical protein